MRENFLTSSVGALTAESFFDKDEWIWLYNNFGYTGDYEFIYFE